MPDAAEQLRRDLLGAIAADAAATRTGSPNAVRAIGRRRRRRRAVVAAAAALTVAAGTAAALGLPVRDSAGPSRMADGGPANGSATAPYLLDEGTAQDGPWSLVVTEQGCVERRSRYGGEAACSLDGTGRLQDASSFRTEDDGQPVVIVNGAVQDGTSKVEIRFADRASVPSLPVLVDGRLFFSARTPAGVRITEIVATNRSGGIVARVGALPPPPP